VLEGLSRRIAGEVSIAAFGVPMETFDSSVVDRVTELIDEQDVRAGQVLWPRGQVVDTLYIMHDGRVRAARGAAPPWTFEGRWFLGDFEAHLDLPASRSLVAISDFHAFKIGRRVWHGLLEDSADLARLSVTESAAAVARLDARLPDELRPRLPSLKTPSVRRALTTVERIAFLADLRIARSAGIQALADLADASDEIALEDGETLFEAANSRDRFFVVVDGVVEAFRLTPKVFRCYGTGEVVTGAAALANESQHWAARARGRARLIGIPFETWFDMMDAHFDLAHSTIAVLAAERELLLDRLAAQAGPGGIVLGPSRAGEVKRS
jgi:CRP-like cAMP-binding protein